MSWIIVHLLQYHTIGIDTIDTGVLCSSSQPRLLDDQPQLRTCCYSQGLCSEWHLKEIKSQHWNLKLIVSFFRFQEEVWLRQFGSAEWRTAVIWPNLALISFLYKTQLTFLSLLNWIKHKWTSDMLTDSCWWQERHWPQIFRNAKEKDRLRPMHKRKHELKPEYDSCRSTQLNSQHKTIIINRTVPLCR